MVLEPHMNELRLKFGKENMPDLITYTIVKSFPKQEFQTVSGSVMPVVPHFVERRQ